MLFNCGGFLTPRWASCERCFRNCTNLRKEASVPSNRGQIVKGSLNEDRQVRATPCDISCHCAEILFCLVEAVSTDAPSWEKTKSGVGCNFQQSELCFFSELPLNPLFPPTPPPASPPHPPTHTTTPTHTHHHLHAPPHTPTHPHAPPRTHHHHHAQTLTWKNRGSNAQGGERVFCVSVVTILCWIECGRYLLDSERCDEDRGNIFCSACACTYPWHLFTVDMVMKCVQRQQSLTKCATILVAPFFSKMCYVAAHFDMQKANSVTVSLV